MIKKNLFQLGPKELSTSAFWAWLAYYVDDYGDDRQKRLYFSKLLLDDHEFNGKISKVRVWSEQSFKGGRVDLLLEFYLDEKRIRILCENKTTSFTSQNQLSKYSKKFPKEEGFHHIYLKLDYIDSAELQLCSDFGFRPLDGRQLYDTLLMINFSHPIIKEYLVFLEEVFLYDYSDIEQERFYRNRFTNLEKARFQRFFMDKLLIELERVGREKYTLGYNSSKGKPYAKISFAKTPNAIGTKNEHLFWRMDRRAGAECIRLNQWSKIIGNAPALIKQKKNRRNALRELAKEILKDFENLNAGKVNNRGINESEIVIFFLGPNRNTLTMLLEELPRFNHRFSQAYSGLA